MRKGMSKKAMDAIKDEDKLIDLIDTIRMCGEDVEDLVTLVKKRKFTKDIKMQNDAALLCRGINIKLAALQAHADLTGNNAMGFIKIISELSTQFTKLFEKVQIDITHMGRVEIPALTQEDRNIISGLGDKLVNAILAGHRQDIAGS